MISIGEGIFIFGLVRLLISFINWVAQLRLANSEADIVSSMQTEHFASSLSVLIPARNEADNIGNLLTDLLAFPYQPAEIIVYDDLSKDSTPTIVRMFAARHSHIRLLRGTPPPEGWLGKNYACYKLAKAAQGNKFLFLDADVRVKPGLIERTCNYMKRYKLKLLSIFPVQDMPNRGVRLAVPLMNWILLSLLILPAVRLISLPALSAANGQFMLFDAATYKNIQPHRQFRSNRVEDIAIIKDYKRKKIKVATLAGTGDIHCTMYHSLSEAIEGFSKNIFQFFGGSLFLTYGFAVITTISLFYLLIFNGILMALIYLAVILLIRVFTSLTSRQPVKENLLLMIPQQIVFWKIIINATLKRKQKKLIWKDRNISTVQ